MSANNHFLFSSESVSEGHPDKVADQISDAILDAYLEVDSSARVACETLITNNRVVIAGEITSLYIPEKSHTEIAREVIRRIGYTSKKFGFDCDKAEYIDATHTQSREIGASVSEGGAGDQGFMFGYACSETPEMMPVAITLAHRMMLRQTELRKSGVIPWLLPDAKSQVTVAYEKGKPVDVKTVVLSTQHLPGITQKEIADTVREKIILPIVREYFPAADPVCLVNPSGSFLIGGPYGDTGLTGRKIIVDTYGGSCPHGGGAFSGKDATKVDRTGAYAARWVAKHIIEAKWAERCTVQIAYAIGVEEPVSLHIDFHGTEKVMPNLALDRIKEVFELRPRAIIEKLGLRQPIYQKTASGGHFGRNEFPWEKTDPELLERMKGVNAKVDYHRLYLEYQAKFSAYTDEQLIEVHNSHRNIEIVGNGAMTGMRALHQEFLNRNLNSEIITRRDPSGRINGYNYEIPIALKVKDGQKVLVREG